jgi:preprotein translocase subunit SecF
MFMKLRFPWFLHPVAFPIAISESIQGYTVAIFAVWLLKTMLLRYGGLRAHRTALPLFLGLIVGYSSYMLVEGVVRLFFAT